MSYQLASDAAEAEIFADLNIGKSRSPTKTRSNKALVASGLAAATFAVLALVGPSSVQDVALTALNETLYVLPGTLTFSSWHLAARPYGVGACVRAWKWACGCVRVRACT